MDTLTSATLLNQRLSQQQGRSFLTKTSVFFSVLVVFILMSTAYAQGDDAGFVDIEALDRVWTFLSGLVTGMLGKFIALLCLLGCFWQVREQNWGAAGGVGLLCLLLAFGPSLIEGLFSAGVPI